jgi:hypothetical protein
MNKELRNTLKKEDNKYNTITKEIFIDIQLGKN